VFFFHVATNVDENNMPSKYFFLSIKTFDLKNWWIDFGGLI